MNFLIKLFSRKSEKDQDIIERPTYSRGFEGDLNVESALAFEKEQIILAVNYDFSEAPTLVEFDLHTRHINLLQSSGDIATLGQLTVPLEEEEKIRAASKVTLVTGTGAEKLLQVLALRVKPVQKKTRSKAA